MPDVGIWTLVTPPPVTNARFASESNLRPSEAISESEKDGPKARNSEVIVPKTISQLTANDYEGLCGTTYTHHSLQTNHQKRCLALFDNPYPTEALEPTFEQTFFLNNISLTSPFKVKCGESL